jgi:glyoxylase-like metal-dependent hydrolase (beta-lactamase superfamily II)
MLIQEGMPALEQEKAISPELADVELRIPDVIFEEGDMFVHLGDKSLQMVLMPGHTPDSTVVHVLEDKVLVAADTIMPVPYFVWGNREEFIASLKSLHNLGLESVVQGHGEVLLRGEIPGAINSSLRYLELAYKKVSKLVEEGKGTESLSTITIEKCGKSRIPLNGLVQDLHIANLYTIYGELVKGAKIPQVGYV